MKKSGFITALTLGATPLLASFAGAAPQSSAPSLAAKAKVSVELVGEVASPGNYEFSKDKPTLLDLVLLSGGLTRNPAQVHVKVQRGKQTFDVNIENLLKLKINFTLQNGDLVIVTANRVFVGGAVKNPGYYSLPETGTLSVAASLALAGGAIEAEGNAVTRVTASEGSKPTRLFLPISPGDFNQLLHDGDSLLVSNTKVKVSPFIPVIPGIPRPYVAPEPQFKGRFYLLKPNSNF